MSLSQNGAGKLITAGDGAAGGGRGQSTAGSKNLLREPEQRAGVSTALGWY